MNLDMFSSFLLVFASDPTKIKLYISSKRFGTIEHNLKQFDSFVLFSIHFKFISFHNMGSITVNCQHPLLIPEDKDEVSSSFSHIISKR